MSLILLYQDQIPTDSIRANDVPQLIKIFMQLTRNRVSPSKFLHFQIRCWSLLQPPHYLALWPSFRFTIQRSGLLNSSRAHVLVRHFASYLHTWIPRPPLSSMTLAYRLGIAPFLPLDCHPWNAPALNSHIVFFHLGNYLWSYATPLHSATLPIVLF